MLRIHFLLITRIVKQPIDNEPNENIKDNNTLEDDYSKVIVAKKDKTIVGFISIYLIDESTAEICGFVLPEYLQ